MGPTSHQFNRGNRQARESIKDGPLTPGTLYRLLDAVLTVGILTRVHLTKDHHMKTMAFRIYTERGDKTRPYQAWCPPVDREGRSRHNDGSSPEDEIPPAAPPSSPATTSVAPRPCYPARLRRVPEAVVLLQRRHLRRHPRWLRSASCESHRLRFHARGRLHNRRR